MPRGTFVSDDDLLDAVHAAIAADAVDLLEGGVPPEEVADRVGLTVRHAEGRLRALVREGRLRKVRGADPESYTPRVSYLPANGEASDS